MTDLSDFDFDLPEELIALRPARPRRAARLLDATGEAFADRHVSDLPGLLRPGDLLVLNDTRVIPARLFGERRRPSGETARMEALLMERLAPDAWRALARPGKRLREGDDIRFSEGLAARLAEKGEGGEVVLRFDRSGADLDAAVAACGVMPLPPYIAGKRPADADDDADYQTLFAARPGAVAAPTAALHFDPPLMEALAARGVETARLTLHVGAGTFLPVKADRLGDHKMHAEWGELPPETAEAVRAARARGARVVAVGTTSLRLLETAARDNAGEIRAWRGLTDIFITPGWRFHGADLLMTNFHLPRSTLFMLVCAFAGKDRMRAAYAQAIAARYRFYSYGDSSLLGLAPSLR